MAGYNDKILIVDLTQKTTTIKGLDNQTKRKFLGGSGLGAKIHY